MADAKLRHAIAFEAARLMYTRSESEYFTAKRKIADLVVRINGHGWKRKSNRGWGTSR